MLLGPLILTPVEPPLKIVQLAIAVELLLQAVYAGPGPVVDQTELNLFGKAYLPGGFNVEDK